VAWLADVIITAMLFNIPPTDTVTYDIHFARWWRPSPPPGSARTLTLYPDGYEIADETGRLLHVVSFDDVLEILQTGYYTGNWLLRMRDGSTEGFMSHGINGWANWEIRKTDINERTASYLESRGILVRSYKEWGLKYNLICLSTAEADATWRRRFDRLRNLFAARFSKKP
jgi:hypothetical protein